MNLGNFLEKMGGESGREICHDNFTGESSPPVKLLKPSEVTELFPGVTLSKSDYVAYLPARMCRSLPVVNARGRCFTPPVMGKSAASTMDALVDVEHILKDNQFKRDMIVGHIKAWHFPGMRSKDLASVDSLPLVPEQPMSLSVLMALFMRSDAVPRILQEHLSGETIWGTSMETYFKWKDCAFYYENEFIPVPDAPEDMLDCVSATSVRDYKGRKLALALGGERGEIDYCAIGLTASPADKGCDIMALVAGRDVASTGRKYFPVKLDVKTGSWKNSEQALEIANKVADENFKEMAAIEVLGQTQPAEDGHVHDILTDGTIVPANGHTHYSSYYQLVRGTTPRYTARTSEHTTYMDSPSHSTGITHFHLIDIPLRGGKKSKDSEDSVATEVASLRDALNSLEGNMAVKLSDLLAKLEKVVLSPVKSGEAQGQPNADIANLVSEIRQYRMEDEIKSEVGKQVASMIEAGDMIKKDDHQKAIDEAVKKATDELTAKHKEEQEAQTKLAARLKAVTDLGVDVEYVPDGSDKTYRDQFAAISFDATGEALFATKLETLKAQVELAKAKEELAKAKVPAEGTTPALANDGKSKKRSFLIGGKTDDAADMANEGKSPAKTLMAKYG